MDGTEIYVTNGTKGTAAGKCGDLYTIRDGTREGKD